MADTFVYEVEPPATSDTSFGLPNGESWLILDFSFVSSQKPYAQAYKALKQNIRFDDDFLDMMYNSKYAQHFYTAEELEQFRARWGVS